MTKEVVNLLQQYGLLVTSMSHLVKERPRSPHESLEEYYKSLGAPLPDEPILAVRISADNELHFRDEGEHDLSMQNERGKRQG